MATYRSIAARVVLGVGCVAGAVLAVPGHGTAFAAISGTPTPNFFPNSQTAASVGNTLYACPFNSSLSCTDGMAYMWNDPGVTATAPGDDALEVMPDSTAGTLDIQVTLRPHGSACPAYYSVQWYNYSTGQTNINNPHGAVHISAYNQIQVLPSGLGGYVPMTVGKGYVHVWLTATFIGCSNNVTYAFPTLNYGNGLVFHVM